MFDINCIYFLLLHQVSISKLTDHLSKFLHQFIISLIYSPQHVLVREFRASCRKHMDAASDPGAIPLLREQAGQGPFDKAIRIRGSNKHAGPSAAFERQTNKGDANLPTQRRLGREKGTFRSERLHRHPGLR